MVKTFKAICGEHLKRVESEKSYFSLEVFSHSSILSLLPFQVNSISWVPPAPPCKSFQNWVCIQAGPLGLDMWLIFSYARNDSSPFCMVYTPPPPCVVTLCAE